MLTIDPSIPTTWEKDHYQHRNGLPNTSSEPTKGTQEATYASLLYSNLRVVNPRKISQSAYTMHRFATHDTYIASLGSSLNAVKNLDVLNPDRWKRGIVLKREEVAKVPSTRLRST